MSHHFRVLNFSFPERHSGFSPDLCQLREMKHLRVLLASHAEDMSTSAQCCNLAQIGRGKEMI